MNSPKKTLRTNSDGTVSFGKSGINHSRAIEIGKRYSEVKKKCDEASKKATP